MIKPESLWALFKKCPDSEFLGDICRALAGQDVELDFGQQMIVKIIENEMEAYDD